LNNTTSQIKIISSGCAQGSILGPLLFLIYISNFLFLNLHGDGRLYADDAVFIYKGSSYEEISWNICDDLSKIESFLTTINMKISLSKTKFMFFSHLTLDNNYLNEIHYNGNSIFESV
jgi:Reverse transcriptase (RNA-dependent DNA polymerase)